MYMHIILVYTYMIRLEHRLTRGFEHGKNRGQSAIKPVVAYDPHSLGPPEFPLDSGSALGCSRLGSA